MRRKGINYDTGFFPAGGCSRPRFDHDQVRAELDLIAGELRCDAVRISGGDLDRITFAAQHAAASGLEVWFAPLPCELDPARVRELLADAAERAEHVRQSSGSEVVLVLGGELTGRTPPKSRRFRLFSRD